MHGTCSCLILYVYMYVMFPQLQSVAETPVVAATPDKDTSRELLSEKLEDDEPDGIFTFKRKPHVKYHHVSACLLSAVGGGYNIIIYVHVRWHTWAPSVLG